MAPIRGPTKKLAGGIDMPLIGLGCWAPSDAGTFSPEVEQVVTAVNEAIAVGYRAFDTALVYNTEEAIGRALKSNFERGLVKREDVFITTKLPGTHMATPELVKEAINLSLKNLQLDYIDLYLIHGPWAFQPSGGTDVLSEGHEGFTKANFEVIWKAMEDMVDAGKIRALGLSNMNTKQIDRIAAVARHPVSNLQVECHAYLQQNQLKAFCKEKGILLTAYSPIGAPGRPDFLKKADQKPIIEDPVVVNLAKKYNRSPAQILLRWHLQKGVAVVPKSVTPKRIKENFEITDFTLDQTDITSIDALNKNLRYFEFKEELGSHPDHPYNEDN